jgi:hypothetical protein
MTAPLDRTVTAARALRERLATIYGEEIDEQTLLDTVDGQTDIEAAIIAVARERAETDCLADALAERVKEMQARKARLDARSDRLKAVLTWAMEETGRRKIVAPEFTLSLSDVRKSVIVTDEAAIPTELVKTTTSTSPDKAAIKAKLDAGEEVPGARLSNGGNTVSVRPK